LKKVIVTGQQIGLLGGPLYTTYKVLGAVSLSRKLKGRAIYWLETNDADFEEINHIEYLDGRGKPITLKWEKKSQGYSCGFIEVDRKLVSLIDRFFDSLRQTEFTGGLIYFSGKHTGLPAEASAIYSASSIKNGWQFSGRIPNFSIGTAMP
jgi:uncharacterized protein YllA (UPF0747 family)